MKIKTIPKHIDAALYARQKEQAVRWIKAPIMFVERGDPAFGLLDERLSYANNVATLSAEHVDFTIHEIIPGKRVAWFSSDMDDEPVIGILVNASDLKIIRETGYFGLQIATLLKDF